MLLGIVGVSFVCDWCWEEADATVYMYAWVTRDLEKYKVHSIWVYITNVFYLFFYFFICGVLANISEGLLCNQEYSGQILTFIYSLSYPLFHLKVE